MSERHKRKNAREMLSKAGYPSGGHFKTEKMIGEAVHEHEGALHPGKPKTKLKYASGGSVLGMAPAHHAHKPRGHKGGKKGHHTTVNVVVGAGKQPVPVPVPMGGPPPIGPGGPPGPGAMPMPPPGMMPPGAHKGGRYAKGGTVKEESGRDPIKSTSGMVEGKLKAGGKAKKLWMGGGGGMNPAMRASPGALFGGSPGASSGGGNTVMGVNPGGGMASPGGPGQSAPLQGRPTPYARVNEGLMSKGGKAKTKKVIDAGSGGGLGRLEKARAYGAKV